MTPAKTTAGATTRLLSIAITVEDLDRAVRWWERVFGFEVVARTRFEAVGADVALIKGLGFQLELLQVPERYRIAALTAKPPGHLLPIGNKSLVLETDDLKATSRALEEHGVTFIWRERDFGVLGHATAIRDSEGNLINIFQRQEP
jgi:catechol 2,3-dioxygenase-like lactoylglutathione lyase family enzyme